jgi:hypothetical protein
MLLNNFQPLFSIGRYPPLPGLVENADPFEQ